MVIADVGHRVDDHLAVELQRDAKHPVHAGMVRAEIQKHEVGVLCLLAHAPLFRNEAQSLLLGVEKLRRHAEGIHLRGAGRMFLTQRVALPVGRCEDASQVRMPGEVDPEHVEYFALVPVGGRPGSRYRRYDKFVFAQGNLDAQVLVPIEADEVVEDGEVGIGLAAPRAAQTLVDRRDIKEQRESGPAFQVI